MCQFLSGFYFSHSEYMIWSPKDLVKLLLIACQALPTIFPRCSLCNIKALSKQVATSLSRGSWNNIVCAYINIPPISCYKRTVPSFPPFNLSINLICWKLIQLTVLPLIKDMLLLDITWGKEMGEKTPHRRHRKVLFGRDH